MKGTTALSAVVFSVVGGYDGGIGPALMTGLIPLVIFWVITRDMRWPGVAVTVWADGVERDGPSPAGLRFDDVAWLSCRRPAFAGRFEFRLRAADGSELRLPADVATTRALCAHLLTRMTRRARAIVAGGGGVRFAPHPFVPLGYLGGFALCLGALLGALATEQPLPVSAAGAALGALLLSRPCDLIVSADGLTQRGLLGKRRIDWSRIDTIGPLMPDQVVFVFVGARRLALYVETPNAPILLELLRDHRPDQPVPRYPLHDEPAGA